MQLEKTRGTHITDASGASREKPHSIPSHRVPPFFSVCTSHCCLLACFSLVLLFVSAAKRLHELGCSPPTPFFCFSSLSSCRSCFQSHFLTRSGCTAYSRICTSTSTALLCVSLMVWKMQGLPKVGCLCIFLSGSCDWPIVLLEESKDLVGLHLRARGQEPDQGSGTVN